jgi:hypothetical protein
MDDSKTPAPGGDREHADEISRLEQMLNEGLDDLEAGRVISKDDMRRKIEGIFSAHQAKQTTPKHG